MTGSTKLEKKLLNPAPPFPSRFSVLTCSLSTTSILVVPVPSKTADYKYTRSMRTTFKTKIEFD